MPAPPGRSPFLQGSVRHPDKAALDLGGAVLAYGRLAQAARRWRDGLDALGIRPGDRVAVLLPAGAEHLIALAGHLLGGVVHVPVNGRYREEEIRHVLTDSGAAALLSAPEAIGQEVARDLLRTGALRCSIVAGGGPPEPGERRFEEVIGAPAEAFLSGAAARPAEDAIAPPPAGDLDAAAVLVYTSGTTGRAKGVALSQRALAANLGAVTRLWRWGGDDRLALALPWFHVHGLGLGVLGSLLHGMTVVAHERFDPAALVADFRDRGASVFMGVPTMYHLLLAHLRERPGDAAALRRGRLFTSGSAPLAAEDARAFAALTGHAILERYGMTETGFTLSNPYDGERRPGTVGLPVPGYAVRIVDEAGSPCRAGDLGEIQVRGDGMMRGYWNLPAETAAAFRDGWFLTGDLGAVDEEGYHRIAGRISVDIIKSGGFKISAREIEEVLGRHPGVADVAVIGIADPLWGEAIAAVVAPRGGARPADEAAWLADLAAFAAERLADYKKPRALRLVEALPRNAMGKVEKHRLRQLF